MLRIALVEDTLSEAQYAIHAINRFCEQENIHERFGELAIERFEYAQKFLDASRSQDFDLIIMDIDMPYGQDSINGMNAAAQFREQSDSHADIPILFTTKVSQLAAQGYQVNAIGYVVKPYDYATFAMFMKRAIANIDFNLRGITLTVATRDGVSFVPSSDIIFIQVRDHLIDVHLRDGQLLTTWGKLRTFCEQLKDSYFVQCNRDSLVNMRYVAGFNDSELFIRLPQDAFYKTTDEVQEKNASENDIMSFKVSRRKKSEVYDALFAVKSRR
ncbi:response regulator transcription factor [Alloscardovia theropitheci]|uniref:Response regulator transcription factor n=1 Tax=Alloscardovia theropitheci TaxID=2496842 RepID=A0A4R0QPB2_9BIFI|nr:LytTR family DNA-binding domain-containing protein [Alloscardovia theropitheci]TCD54044.1 response regulator transcription factor [Alloscardovia theropitheci]